MNWGLCYATDLNREKTFILRVLLFEWRHVDWMVDYRLPLGSWYSIPGAFRHHKGNLRCSRSYDDDRRAAFGDGVRRRLVSDQTALSCSLLAITL